MSGGEVNIKSIRALEEQIREHEMAIIELKRTRNSLLNVSKLPPEVLGDIFHWNVALRDDFDELDKRSHNFLFVCHHWLEVALQTPEIWSFWGDTPKEWARWYPRSGTAPLDLVLGDHYHGDSHFDTTLCDVLRDRATQDTIRRVHLKANDPELLNAIISSISATCEGIQSSSVESFILCSWKHNRGDSSLVDVSNFFAHYCFPKLQQLELLDCTISSWNHLTSRTTALTTLDLNLKHPSPTPTTSQLLSILASNPALRTVVLANRAIPDDSGDGSSSQIQLHHLKRLQLKGDLRHVTGLLHRLAYPRIMDSLCIVLYDCAIADISQSIGPCLRDYLQRRGRSQSGLGLGVSLSSEGGIRFHVRDVGGIDLSAPAPARMKSLAFIGINTGQALPKDVMGKLTLDLIAHVPREEFVYFKACEQPVAMEDVSARFPNLKALHSLGTPLPAIFPTSNLDMDGDIFPSLQHVCLDSVVVKDDDWSPLTTFLARRSSSGNPLHSLGIAGRYCMRPEVLKSIRSMVRQFRMNGT
ncbi:hypothetical protein BDM02DRAFT_3118156 [Thelephora ganbajun]|uniref:Uncharacterized protein n=2 Tax=Thelephora ganbajun TaxID=370292 RepID=A0ACB6ZBL0_THEGA|nr:hypothetical protein BDM02DRAFT_3118153 [Thelephora ganbajun]KAF9646759.1 hypothetical protein BDM02DRAFT_3118156 [Thelephora ganbajun]